MSNITIRDYQVRYNTHDMYDVGTNRKQIRTLVTDLPAYVDEWIMETHNGYYRNTVNRIVGLDIEWLPNQVRNVQNYVATLQLSGNCCLIFQLLHSPHIPQSLADFLNNSAHTFVGVGINSDVEKLSLDYNLTTAKTVDLPQLAEHMTEDRSLRKAGLKTLASRILGLELDKPKSTTMSDWDKKLLMPEQVQYACVDVSIL